jgi:hypothetical protein
MPKISPDLSFSTQLEIVQIAGLHGFIEAFVQQALSVVFRYDESLTQKFVHFEFEFF